jgi:ADP-ribose pyrophosphatase
LKGWKIVSETVLRGRVFNVRRDTINIDDRRIVREVVEHPGAVAIIPVLDTGEIILVRQYRHAVGDELLEIPAGTIEDGEKPEECAERELVEETGYRAGTLVKIGEYFLAPGYSTELIHLFKAARLVKVGADNQEDEDIMIVPCRFEDALEMVDRGLIRDAKTIAGLFIFSRNVPSRS